MLIEFLTHSCAFVSADGVCSSIHIVQNEKYDSRSMWDCLLLTNQAHCQHSWMAGVNLMSRFIYYVLPTWQCLLTAFVIKHQEIGRIRVCAMKGAVTNSSKLPRRHSPQSYFACTLFKYANFIRIHLAVFTITEIQTRYKFCISVHCIVYQTAQTWLDNKTHGVVQDVEGCGTGLV